MPGRWILFAAPALLAGSVAAQQPIRVVPGWGVDTTGAVAWSDVANAADVREIYRRWAEYLRSNPRAQTPTALWSAAEQRRWATYDLTAPIAYQGFPATVLDIRPTTTGATEYVVKTLFATAAGSERDVKPIALTRVYAIRENGEWVFSNALPRLTRDWQERTFGPITYVIEPGYAFDTGRAESAVRFADSLAVAFDVPRLQQLTYYVASSPDQVHRILGVDWTVGGVGFGYANTANRQIFSGIPAIGEDYRHELVHFVLGPLHADRRTHPIIAEGIATWLGGSMGRDFATLVREYATFLQSRADITLDSVLATDGPDLGTRPGGAMLTLMVHEHGGTPAIKDLLSSGRSTPELQSALSRILGMDWAEVAKRWRARLLAYSHSPSSLERASARTGPHGLRTSKSIQE